LSGVIRSLWVAELTWPEVEQAVAAGYDSLLLMLGATEQHGPHLPLATDSLIAQELAQAIATRLGKTLIAPVVPLGTSDEHLDFAGTLSLSKSTLAGLIADIGRSAARHNFKRLIVLTAHGGNYDAIRAGTAQLRRDYPALEVMALTDLLEWLQMEATRQAPEATISPQAAGWHAGERETSQLLHLWPALVRLEKAEAGYVGDFRAILPQLTTVGLRPVTPNGVLGDPANASPERGRLYLEQSAQALTDAIKAKIEDRKSKIEDPTLVGNTENRK
jgi:creatinine amidohydrolase